MNRTIGFAMLVVGVLFILSGVLNVLNSSVGVWNAVCSLDPVLFAGGGLGLLVVGFLLMNDVHLAPPGSLMVRRGKSQF